MNQQYNIKFPNINLLDVMGHVVEKHTKHYQTDFFDVDTELLRVATSKVSCLDRTFLWLCRENGTWLLRERDVFIQGTRESNTFRFYIEQTHEPVLLFAVEVNGISRFDGSVVGNLYPMDYRKLYDHVKAICFRSTSVLMRYEYGELVKPVEQFDGYPDNEFGELKSYQFFPEDEGLLRSLLREEKRKREQFTENDVTDYLANL